MKHGLHSLVFPKSFAKFASHYFKKLFLRKQIVENIEINENVGNKVNLTFTCPVITSNRTLERGVKYVIS